MKITSELLEHYNASQQFIDFINNKYPSGLEFLELIKNGIVPVGLLHYIRQYCSLTPEEFEAYEVFCNIRDSENIWDSQCVERSKNLYACEGISCCEFVRNSNNIKGSTDIYNSENIKNSNDVAHSTDVENSHSIIESQTVKYSNNVARSDRITWSNNVLNCSHLDDCSFTYKCNDLVDCHFCGFVNNSRRCLFCSGLEDKEYYIFNKEVTPAEYEEFKEVLLSKVEDETSKMIIIDSSKHLSEERFRLNRRFDSIFNGLSKEFYGWVGTAPNYSDDTFLSLFFRDRE